MWRSQVARSAMRAGINTLFTSGEISKSMTYVREYLGLDFRFESTHTLVKALQETEGVAHINLNRMVPASTTEQGQTSIMSALAPRLWEHCDTVQQFYALIKHIQRVDPKKPDTLDLKKAPFFTSFPGKPLFNTVTAFLWFEVYAKWTHMDEFLLPQPGKSMRDVVFSKIRGSDEFIINEEFMAYCDYVLCTAPSAGRDPAILKQANDHYKYQLTLYKRRSVELVSKTGVTLRPWRDELAEILEAWRVQGPGAPNMRHKRKSRSSDLKDDVVITLLDYDL